MPTPSVNPTALVLFASDRYWPSLQGLLHWATGLRHVFIHWTGASREAAQRLQNFCDDFVRGQRPEIVIHRPEQALATLPQDVRRQIEAWRGEHAGERWLVLDAGHDPLLLCGLAPLALHPDLDLVSRGTAGRWFQLVPDEDGIRTDSLDVSPHATDAIPVAVVLRHFWTDAYNESAAIYPLGALELARKGLHHRGEWERVAQDAGQPEMAMPFEAFLAQAMREMGVDNLAVLQTRLAGVSDLDLETEIVINRGGLRVIDGNLNRLEGLAGHLRRLAQGLEARALFLWPTRSFPDEFRGLLSAYRLDLLEGKDVGRFFQRLAGFVGSNALPLSMVEAEKLMEDVAQRGLRFFPSRRPRPSNRPPRPERKPKGQRGPARPEREKSAPPPRRTAPVAPPQHAVPIEPRDAAFDQAVSVKILGPFHLGNLRGFDVQEQGWPVGVLAWGAAPNRKPRFGEVITVYRENLDPKNPRYRWDRKP